jgi:transcriptional regulator with XRE-family HTH domain
MDLKRIFILNVKKYRNGEGISQMSLAERCDTSASYIGEIEIGRKFPSIEMIEKIAAALRVDAYQLFRDEMNETPEALDETKDFLIKLPRRIKADVKNRLLSSISSSIEDVLNP